jgi:hypothetical protein
MTQMSGMLKMDCSDKVCKKHKLLSGSKWFKDGKECLNSMNHADDQNVL